MGCSSWKQDDTIDSTRSIKDLIKSKYKIEDTLTGDGVFGKVFLAHIKDEPDKKVAIKGNFTIPILENLL